MCATTWGDSLMCATCSRAAALLAAAVAAAAAAAAASVLHSMLHARQLQQHCSAALAVAHCCCSMYCTILQRERLATLMVDTPLHN
jgi:hypothetical protein